MSPIKDFNLVYESLNENGTFSEGDTISGAVTFTLTKQTKVKGLMVKAKGDANVHWTEGSGEDETSYSAHKRYFKLKEYLVPKNANGTALPEGVHHFKFRFKIPQGDMPSSFRGAHGKIVYMVEAKMSRSWRWPTEIQTEFKFVSKSLSHPGHIMCPQSGSMGKKMGGFSKGQVQMSATVNRKVCSPGDTLSVVAQISNSSSKKMKPKFSFQQKEVYRASGSTNSSDKTLCKMVGETIAENSEETVSCQLQIPLDVIYTLHNCEIISVEHYLKVYLDIKFAFDPEVVFPLVIIPSSFAALQPDEAVGPYPAGGQSYSDFPPSAFPVGPYPAPTGSGTYGYPAQHTDMTSGFNYQWPQQAAPVGVSTAASSLVEHQTPTAPPLFQQGDAPPSYTSIFSSSQETFGSTGSDDKC